LKIERKFGTWKPEGRLDEVERSGQKAVIIDEGPIGSSPKRIVEIHDKPNSSAKIPEASR